MSAKKVAVSAGVLLLVAGSVWFLTGTPISPPREAKPPGESTSQSAVARQDETAETSVPAPAVGSDAQSLQLSGSVIDEATGLALAGVVVEVHVRSAQDSASALGRDTTDLEGTYSFRDPYSDVGEDLVIIARHAEFIVAQQTLWAVNRPWPTPLPTMALRRGGRVEGRVIRSGGVPVPGAIVRARAPVRLDRRSNSNFRVRYRGQLRSVVSQIIRAQVGRDGAAQKLRDWASNNVQQQDLGQFIGMAESELLGVRESNFARYGLKPAEYYAWRQRWDRVV